MNWLITGGCGFIGSSLAGRLLEDSKNKVCAFDNLTIGSIEDLTNNTNCEVKQCADAPDWSVPLSLVVGDISDVEQTKSALKGADVVVHLAANTGVGPSVVDPVSDCKNNVQGTLNVLEACRTAEVTRMVFASSGAPLGVQTPPLHEEMAARPMSPCGASKLAGEGYCSAYFHCFGIKSVVLRFGNVYGEGSAKKESVVAKFIKRAMNGEILEIYGDGDQTRDFIHISDLLEAVYLAATTDGVGGEVFQIATAKETTMNELTEALVEAIQNVSGIKPEWICTEARLGDVARNYSDTRKAKEQLGWAALVNLEEGLHQTVRSYM